jgi:hypothetical protein
MKADESFAIADGRVRLTRFGVGSAALAGLYEPVAEADARAVTTAGRGHCRSGPNTTTATTA